MAIPKISPFTLADAERTAELATPMLLHLAKASRPDSIAALSWATAAVIIEYADASKSTLDEALAALMIMTAQTAELMRINFADCLTDLDKDVSDKT